MATLDVSRQSTNVLLPAEVSSEIWSRTIESSAVMQLAQRRALPGAGEEIQTITGDVEAKWVGETEKKPVSKPTFGKTGWKGYKMAVIVPFSNEFRRDKMRLYDEIVARAPQSLGTKLDKTVFGDGTDKPGELFDTFADVATVDVVTDPWKGLVEADSKVSAADGIINGFAISPALKSTLLNALDKNGRPLFVNDMTGSNNIMRLMGQPTYVKKGVYREDTPKQLGIAGDWSSALYGVVEDITMKISEQATITIDGSPVNLWEQNMFAVLFEFEVGFKLKWADHFVRLVDNSAVISLSPGTSGPVMGVPSSASDDSDEDAPFELSDKNTAKELIAYAEEHGIDLEGATKKADMLEKIKAAEEVE